MDAYFTICKYKTEEPRNIEISTLISLEIFGVKQACFP